MARKSVVIKLRVFTKNVQISTADVRAALAVPGFRDERSSYDLGILKSIFGIECAPRSASEMRRLFSKRNVDHVLWMTGAWKHAALREGLLRK
jgi:hypothetical protein